MKTCSIMLLSLVVLSITIPAQKRTRGLPPKPVNTPVSKEETPGQLVKIIHGQNGELTTKDILQNRNISLYDQGGSIDCREWTPEKGSQPRCDEKKVRDFLWAHGTEKRRGYLRIIYNSVDWWGTAHIFIEPQEGDTWHIGWRTVSVSLLPGGRSVIDDLDLNSIERMENKDGGPDDWRIVIKKASGEIFGEFPESK